MTVDCLVIRRPDDWHLHLRDGPMLAAVLPATARLFARAIVMPNLAEPVTTVKAAAAYRNRILRAAGRGGRLTPLMTLYLTDATEPDELEKGYRAGVVTAAKLYPAGATTNAESGVTDIAKIRPVLARMEALDIPLLVHGEVTDGDIDIFDREAVFIDRVLTPLISDFPGLRVVFEHITTAEAVAFVGEAPDRLAATVTPHHLVLNRTDMFRGGLRPHAYCLPVAKRERHRLALRAAAISGDPSGIFNAPVAMEVYAQVFDEEGALDKLENFAAHFGASFYGFPVNEDCIELERKDWRVPDAVPVPGEDGAVVPFMAGALIPWRFVGLAPPNKGPVL
jgi:dihydroorotase